MTTRRTQGSTPSKAAVGAKGRRGAAASEATVIGAPDPVLEDLAAYLWDSPSPYHAVSEAARRLGEAGFTRLDERASWRGLSTGRWMVERGGALVAWVVPERASSASPLRVIGAHTDSPNLRVKPRPDCGSSGWRQVGVEIYGGTLLNSWLDRDLGLSGRVVLADGRVQLVRIDRPLLRVAQLAIHLDREVNEKGVVLDKQTHLTPIWGLGDAADGEFADTVAASVGVAPDTIVAWDLMLHDLTRPALLGRDNELLASARLDNLCSAHAAITAITAITDVSGSSAAGAGEGPIALVALFDHEEVGSGSATGAAGPLLETVLQRSWEARAVSADDRARSIAASICISADMAHAVHPNYADRHEPGHRPLPNGGPVLKVNASQRYASDALTEAAFLRACRAADVPTQVFVSRNNMPCGTTIGPVTATRLGIATVDVGCAQLSMHSARELMGAKDPAMLVAALTVFLAET